MATITTSTTGKKKIIYKQDTDGVFRLKKIPTDGRVRDNDRESKNSAEDHSNELIGCTYQVLDSSTEEPKYASPMPDVVLVCPKDTKHVSHEHQIKQNKQPAKVKNTNTSTPSVRVKVPNIKISTGAFEKMTGIHVPSFVAGCMITLVFVSSSPLISHYTSAIFNVVKLGLFWAILIGGITWYTGVVKLQDSEAIGLMLNGIKDTFFETEVNEEEEEEKDDDNDSHNSRIHDVSDNSSRKNSSEFAIPSVVPRRRSASPIKSARVPLTSVAPFKLSAAPKLDSKFQSNPELVTGQNPAPLKLNRFHTSDPKGYQNHPKKSSIISLGKLRRPSNNSLELTKTKTNQSIPSMELIDSSSSRHSPVKQHSSYHDDPEELPFINEVKLISGEDDFRSDLSDLPPINSSNNVHRLSSITSKQSVLGTRANYNKFLANVQGSDAD